MKSKKFFILGASGFMGSQFAKYLQNNNVEVLTERVDVTDFKEMKSKFARTRPDVVVNFAGVRAYPNIDWCEDHKQETVAVNVSGAINAMIAAMEEGAYPIQIGSGCIYSGGPETLFREDDAPNFYGSFYSRMRIVMQDALKELPVLQLRIRMPIAMYSHPRNLINKIISYKQVVSVPNSVTLIEDMLPAILKLSEVRPVGILNLVNDGYIEHQQILEAYKNSIDQNYNYELISVNELEKSIVKARRSNCILNSEKRKSLGIEMPAVDDRRLRDIMRAYKESL